MRLGRILDGKFVPVAGAQRCACGAVLSMPVMRADWPEAMAAHVAGRQHQRWRDEQGIETPRRRDAYEGQL